MQRWQTGLLRRFTPRNDVIAADFRTGEIPVSECEVDGSEAKSTTATSEKEIKDSPRNEGAAIHRNISNCHPELVSGSYRCEM